ncbi:hypothetical protein WME94_06985 [Sorangium sp. So ce429]
MHDQIPGLLFIDHVGIAVPAGQLGAQTQAYEMLGFLGVHREEVRVRFTMGTSYFFVGALSCHPSGTWIVMREALRVGVSHTSLPQVTLLQAPLST